MSDITDSTDTSTYKRMNKELSDIGRSTEIDTSGTNLTSQEDFINTSVITTYESMYSELSPYTHGRTIYRVVPGTAENFSFITRLELGKVPHVVGNTAWKCGKIF